MRNDFAKRKFAQRRAARRQSIRWVFVVVVLIAVVAGAGLFAYRYQQRPEDFPLMTAGVERFKLWVADRKDHMNQRIAKAGRVVSHRADNDDEPQVHFEFYTALPNMQIPKPEIAETNSKEPNTSKKLVAALSTPSKALPAVTKKAKALPVVISASDVERELSEQLKRKKG